MLFATLSVKASSSSIKILNDGKKQNSATKIPSPPPLSSKVLSTEGWEITTSCGDVWSCSNCPDYTYDQLVLVKRILNSLCGTDVTEIWIAF